MDISTDQTTLLQVGRDRLLHIAYMHPACSGLLPRILSHRRAIMRNHPGKQLSQHVIVMGDDQFPGVKDLAELGFALDLNVVYLRDMDPGRLLAEPGLAAMATLARGTTGERAEAFRQALGIIHERGGERRADLLAYAIVLARIRLAPPTIRTIIEETGITMASGVAEMFRGSGIGDNLLQDGIETGRVDLLTALLVDRFGNDSRIPNLVQQLQTASNATAAHVINNATNLDDVAAA